MFKLLRLMVAAILRRLGEYNAPEDPYVAVREPRRRTPGGRSSSVALAEPEPLKHIRAVGVGATVKSPVDYQN